MKLWIVWLVLAACGGSSASTTPGTPAGGVQMKEVTDPWKSMELPVGTALVEVSTSKTLVLRHPTLKLSMMQSTYAAFRQHLVSRGWSIQDEVHYDEGTDNAQYNGIFQREGRTMTLGVEKSRAGGLQISLR